MSTSLPQPGPTETRRSVVPASTVILATLAALIVGFVLTVGCSVWSLDRAAGRTERELQTALWYMGAPLLAAALCAWGALARYRAANKHSKT